MTCRNQFPLSKIPIWPRRNKQIVPDVASRPPRRYGAARCHERTATRAGGARFVTTCGHRPCVSHRRKSMTLPSLGVDRPRPGMTLPLRGMDHPFPGITRPFPGMARPLRGGDHPRRGMGRPLRGVDRRRQGGSHPRRGGRRRRAGGVGELARRGRRGYCDGAGFPIIGS